MQIEILQASRTVTIWLTSAEAEDPGVQTRLASIYADCAAKKTYTRRVSLRRQEPSGADQKPTCPQPLPDGAAGSEGDAA